MDKKLLEGVQCCAAKLVPELQDLPYEEMLGRLKIPNLSYRSAHGDTIEVYKYT